MFAELLLFKPSEYQKDVINETELLNCAQWCKGRKFSAVFYTVFYLTSHSFYCSDCHSRTDRYMCLILPHSPGAATDLVHDKDLALILKHFVKEKKPICAIAMGVVGLFPAMEDSSSWSFRRYTLTSVSVFELARDPDFASLPVIPEDIIKDRGALYSSSEPDEVHVVVDRHLITGQNEQSTLTAVQNLILLCNQKQGRKDKF
ncbi:glutamine amidotransferase-like class 1 domain-containing protein 1 isoform X2 [Tachypleus tridentatus]|uniref:glutamine amidotransferase-like class 1 domain-containing protein 1 isoform X2 n=1 Tax=Tachypleus tridentatus TaxID=6853 RepID=UPI003FD23645